MLRKGWHERKDRHRCAITSMALAPRRRAVAAPRRGDCAAQSAGTWHGLVHVVRARRIRARNAAREIRVPCTGSGPVSRSALRADCVALLGAGAHGQLTSRPAGTLRSDRGRESEVEARDRAPPRLLRCSPRPLMVPKPVQGTRISRQASCHGKQDIAAFRIVSLLSGRQQSVTHSMPDFRLRFRFGW